MQAEWERETLDTAQEHVRHASRPNIVPGHLIHYGSGRFASEQFFLKKNSQPPRPSLEDGDLRTS